MDKELLAKIEKYLKDNYIEPSRMGKTYGYSPLSYELIELFTSGLPDFEAAEKLIQQGADVNNQGDDKDENILSEILRDYSYSGIDWSREECRYCDLHYECCDYKKDAGASTIQIIKFFLDHGFDVTRNGGKYGAQCLYMLKFSSFSSGREIIDATKILLDAGAQNVPMYEDEPYETPMEDVDWERFINDSKGNHYHGNIYEAVYQIYVALENGRSYAGIDSFEAAIGKKILRVMASGNDKDSIFSSINIPTSKHDNCFYDNLYMLFDGGYLICSKYGSYWVDTAPIDGTVIDVSEFFSSIIGHEIRQVTFGHNEVIDGITHYGQPVTSFHFDNGVKLTFSINHGEVEKGKLCSYYYYGDNEIAQSLNGLKP